MRKKTLVDLLLAVARENDRGITFIGPAMEERFLSYHGLFDAACSVAGVLSASKIPSRTPVVLFVADEMEFLKLFWGCILCNCIPVPVSATSHAGNIGKCLAVFKKLKTPRVITSRKLLHTLRGCSDDDPVLQKQLTERALLLEDNFSSATPLPDIATPLEEDVAFIQFTSGSTGDPKGVMLSHANLVTNVNDIHQAFNPSNEAHRILSWMPLTHDMGLIGFHFVPLAAGWNHYIMPTSLFARRPVTWLRSISKYMITVTGSPNFGFNHVVSALRRDKENGRFDLSSLKVIINGAEQISLKACKDFIMEMGQHRLDSNVILPVYGLAEASLAVTMSKPLHGIEGIYLDRTKISAGSQVKVLPEHHDSATWFCYLGLRVLHCDLKIVDQHGNGVPELTVGEILIRGENVSKGYYNDGECASATTRDGWFATGDLGLIYNHRLVVTGRIKNMIILHGQNYYPHDIERIIDKHLQLGEENICACSVTNRHREEQLVIFVKRHFAHAGELMDIGIQIRKLLSEQLGIAAAEILPIERLPRTSSGKVQYNRLVMMFESGAFDETISALSAYREKQKQDDSPNDAYRDGVLAVVRDVLGDEAGIHTNFFDLGLSSMQASHMVFQINRRLNTNLLVEAVFENPTADALARLIRDGQFASLPEIKKTFGVAEFEITQRQRKFWMLDKVTDNKSKYIIGGAAMTGQRLDRQLLHQAVTIIAKRHQILRSRFVTVDEKVICKIQRYSAGDFKIQSGEFCQLQASDQDAIRIVDQFIFRAFDLEAGPLFRVACFSFAEHDVLAMSFHHSIADGWSLQIIQNELSAVIRALTEGHAPDLEALEIEYADYIGWEGRLLNEKWMDAQRLYWKKELMDHELKINLPFIRRSRAHQDGRYGKLTYRLSEHERLGIENAAVTSRVTPFVVCLAVLTSLFHKYTAQKDIVIGTNFSGRLLREFNNVVGYFLNTVALRLELRNKPSYADLLKQVNDKVKNASRHQLYPFELVSRDLGLGPEDELFNVLVLYRDFDGLSGLAAALPEFDFTAFESEETAAFGDLQFEFIRDRNDLRLNVAYLLNAVPRTDIELFVERYKEGIKSACDAVIAKVDQTL